MTYVLTALLVANLLLPAVKLLVARTKNKTDDAAVAAFEKLAPVILDALKQGGIGTSPGKETLAPAK